MPGIEPVPGVVVLAGVLGALDPFHPADRHDVRAVGQIRCRLLGRRPVRSPVAARSAQCAGSARSARASACGGRVVRRIRDDRIDRAVMVERKRILAGADVAGIDAAQAEGFQMPDQVAVAGTRLGKGPDAAREGTGSAAALLPVASDRNQPATSARSWNRLPTLLLL